MGMVTRFPRVRVVACAVALVACGVIVRGAIMAQQQAPAVGFSPELLVQLEVANLDRSIKFYTEKLGFRLKERRDDLKFAHIETSVPGVEIGLGEVPNPKPSDTVLNFSVKDADAGRKVLEAAGVVFRGPTLDIPGKVKLAGFSDPDGNYLRLAGPSKPAK